MSYAAIFWDIVQFFLYMLTVCLITIPRRFGLSLHTNNASYFLTLWALLSHTKTDIWTYKIVNVNFVGCHMSLC